MKNRYIIGSITLVSVAILTAQTLVDLGQTSSSGEIPKWDGTQWQNAHDDVGIHTVEGGAGVDVATNMGVTTVSFSQQSLNSLPPVGSVTAWLKSYLNTPTLPSNWAECNGQLVEDPDSPYNGQNLPDLNGISELQRFLRGSTTSGETGGSETHNHSHPRVEFDRLDQTYAVTDIGEANHLPPYYEVVWVMRVK